MNVYRLGKTRRVRDGRDHQVKALVIGSTGATGFALLKAAASSDFPVRALARRPDVLNEFVGHHDIVAGDVRNRDSLDAALDGIDVVVSILGSKPSREPQDLLSTGTQNLVDAMQAAGTKRFICITGMGAGDSRGHGGFFYDRLILPTLLKQVYLDKDRQEAIVQASDLDWVLVRPARLTNGAARGAYREITDFSKGQKMKAISRLDVAHFLVGEAQDPVYHRETVNLSN